MMRREDVEGTIVYSSSGPSVQVMKAWTSLRRKPRILLTSLLRVKNSAAKYYAIAKLKLAGEAPPRAHALRMQCKGPHVHRMH